MKPIPILQVVNVVVALVCLAYEWPLRWVAGSNLHRSVVARLLWLPLACLSAVLLYQTTNAALYYAVGGGVYFWGYCEGEVSLLLLLLLPGGGGGCDGVFSGMVLTSSCVLLAGYLRCPLDSAQEV